ncbi:unnamed protein product [Lactuca saligna]|uniref:Uncharacterized protein n=1 Tax=Lactuca saligna TaxID=75948 RepID=A0AA35VRJ4_LACSI|nr:unnamed protein product [Lactuca saligna]
MKNRNFAPLASRLHLVITFETSTLETQVGERSGLASKFPPGLLCRHSGHRDKVVDFHWNWHYPWTIVSVSDDGESTGGGGTLQVLLSFIPRFSSHLWKALVLKTKQDMDIQDRELVNDWLMIIVYKERGFG